MDKELIVEYINKSVIIILRNGFRHTGTIGEMYDESMTFFDIVSNQKIAVSFYEVSVIKEVQSDRTD